MSSSSSSECKQADANACSSSSADIKSADAKYYDAKYIATVFDNFILRDRIMHRHEEKRIYGLPAIVDMWIHHDCVFDKIKALNNLFRKVTTGIFCETDADSGVFGGICGYVMELRTGGISFVLTFANLLCNIERKDTAYCVQITCPNNIPTKNNEFIWPQMTIRCIYTNNHIFAWICSPKKIKNILCNIAPPIKNDIDMSNVITDTHLTMNLVLEPTDIIRRTRSSIS